MTHANVGGEVSIRFLVSYADDTRSESTDPDDFLATAVRRGESPKSVSINVLAWGIPTDTQPRRDIERSFSVDFHTFGSQFQVGSSDANWGKGAVITLNAWLSRHSPWFGRLLGLVPPLSGALMALPVFFVVAAIAHERALTTGLVIVVVLSSIVLATNVWFWRRYLRNRILPNTLIRVTAATKDPWRAVRLVIATVAFVADLVTIIVVLAR